MDHEATIIYLYFATSCIHILILYSPVELAILANNIRTKYLYFDGFVPLIETDMMAYTATALSFMLANLGEPVIFT